MTVTVKNINDTKPVFTVNAAPLVFVDKGVGFVAKLTINEGVTATGYEPVTNKDIAAVLVRYSLEKTSRTMTNS